VRHSCLHAADFKLCLPCSQLGMVGMDGLWPSQQHAPGFQGTAESFMAHCHRVSEQLLGSFAAGLGLEPDFFNRVSACQRCCYCAVSNAFVDEETHVWQSLQERGAAAVSGPYAL